MHVLRTLQWQVGNFSCYNGSMAAAGGLNSSKLELSVCFRLTVIANTESSNLTSYRPTIN